MTLLWTNSNIHKWVNYSYLEISTVEKAADLMREKVANAVRKWKISSDISVIQHPLWFYQIDFEWWKWEWTARQHFYPDWMADNKVHFHWGDIASYIHSWWVQQTIFEKSDTLPWENFWLLELFLERCWEWNIHNVNIGNFTKNDDFRAFVKQIYSNEALEQYAVQYWEQKSSHWIMFPQEQMFIAELSKLETKPWWSYLHQKKYAHTAEIEENTVSAVLLEKNSIDRSTWKTSQWWPLRQFLDKLPDKIENPKQILTRSQALNELDKIIQLT